jgi:hypothetical protein
MLFLSTLVLDWFIAGGFGNVAGRCNCKASSAAARVARTQRTDAGTSIAGFGLRHYGFSRSNAILTQTNPQQGRGLWRFAMGFVSMTLKPSDLNTS